MKRLAGLALATLGLAGLVARGWRDEPPLADSWRSLRLFWSANAPSRLLNSSAFVHDRDLGVALLRADREWPLSWDVRLVLPPDVPASRAEQQLQKTGYVLAPRRVALVRGDTAPHPFRLEALVR